MEFWEEVKRDVQKGMKEGMALVKAGASIAVKKMDELTQEGKKRFQTFDMKTKIHNEIAELGARVFQLSRDGKLKIEDKKATALIARIEKLEAEIAGFEKRTAPKKKAKARKKTTAGKKAVRKKTAVKKKTAAKKKTTSSSA